MSLKTLGAKITGKFAKQVFTIKEGSPVLLAGVGAVGVIATAVLASRATMKASAVLAEADENLSKVETDQDVVEVRTAITIAKLYAPAVIVGAITLGAMTGSVVILKRRHAAMSAAFAATNTAFNKYRERVVTDQGEGKDREYMYGGEKIEIVEEGPNGPETRTVTAISVDDIREGKGSPYAKVFDEWNNNYNRQIPGRNADFISQQMLWANDLLLNRGWLTLNDVYDLLGFEPTAAGMRVGWVRGSKDGDNHVSFNIWGNGITDAKEWLIRGSMDPIVLDFNVDGEISEHFDKF
jgi:hypothetical protein